MSDNISIVLAGNEYVDFTRIEVHISFLNICREFSATVSLPDSALDSYPVQIGQMVTVKVNNQPVLTGYIEKLNIKQDGTTRTLKCYSRDYLGDLVDSTMDASIIQPFNGNVSFATVCRRVVSRLGLQSSVVSNIDDSQVFTQNDFITPDVGESCSDYLQKYAEKVQVFLNSDGNGNLVLNRADNPETVQNFLSMQPNDNNNKILSRS